MIRHFFLDKTNTIYKGSRANTGLNPILKLNYGKDISRGLIHFDLSDIKERIFNEEIDIMLSTFRLKMTNCMSVDGLPYEKPIDRNGANLGKRACSFDIGLFKLPQDFDGGRGYEITSDFWVKTDNSHSTDGSNWYFAKTAIPWSFEEDKINLNSPELHWESAINNIVGGIYDNDYLKSESEKYKNGENSIFIGMQHFDFGMENLDIDITDYVRKTVFSDASNFGLGIMFLPEYENLSSDVSKYVGFFTDHTNTFFHPYVEMHCKNEINDDRSTFTLGMKNKLFFYAEVDGEFVNLDKKPVCTIDEKEYPVKKLRKGCYYAEIDTLPYEVEDESIMYDKWSNLALNGQKLEDIEMEFEVHAPKHRINTGQFNSVKPVFVPSISGINDGEAISREDIRTVTIELRQKYETQVLSPSSNIEYRLYVKDGSREYDVIGYAPTEKVYFANYFTIYGMDLIPNDYYVDIKIKDGLNTRNYKEVLKFRVVDNVTERYE